MRCSHEGPCSSPPTQFWVSKHSGASFGYCRAHAVPLDLFEEMPSNKLDWHGPLDAGSLLAHGIHDS
jgi:hypothetical protein